MGNFLKALKTTQAPIADFTSQLWNALVEKATVNADGSMVFTFRNGLDNQAKGIGGKRFGEIPKRFRENAFRQIVSTQFGEMLRRGKMNRRRQRLLQSAPDLLYKEALSEPYNSAKSPGKPLATGTFCPDGVKKTPYQLCIKNW